MNRAQFAKLAGVSRPGIKKAVDTGRVIVGPDGDVDPEHPTNAEYLKIRQGAGAPDTRKREVKSEPGTSRATGKTKSAPKPAGPAQPGQSAEIPEHLRALVDSGEISLSQIMSLSRPEVDKIKIYEQIKQTRVKTESTRRELISRKLIRVVFGRIYEIDQNEYLTIKDKVIPDIAAIFGCTDPEKMLEAGKRLDEELWKTLRHVQHVIDKFLKSVGDDPA